MRKGFFSLMVFLAASPLMAQATRPAPLPADQMLQDMLKPENSSPAQSTTHPSIPTALPDGSGKSAGAGSIREGTEIVDRAGFLRKSPDGPWQEFVFEDEGSGPALPTMRVMPDLKLMSMENATAATSRNLRFVVSGAITEYSGHNYILLESGPDDAGRRFTPASVRPLSTKPVSADQMLNDMLSSTARPDSSPSSPPALPQLRGRMTDKTTGAAAVAPGAPVLTVLREQSQIIDRIGRLVRSADGQQAEFAFDSDGQAMQDPPLIILPNLKLGSMEMSIQQTRKDLQFRATGTLTEYRGRNYILLEKVVVVPDVTQQF
jgi:hypothetical protein